MLIAAKSTIVADFNKDGIKDTATLTDVSGEAVLTVTIAPNKRAGTKEQVSSASVVMDSVKGSDAAMKLTAKGSLQVDTFSGSREITSRRATFAYRGGEMVLAGLKSTTVDTLSEDLATVEYDYNLLSGKGFNGGKPVAFDTTKHVPMGDYDAYSDITFDSSGITGVPASAVTEASAHLKSLLTQRETNPDFDREALNAAIEQGQRAVESANFDPQSKGDVLRLGKLLILLKRATLSDDGMNVAPSVDSQVVDRLTQVWNRTSRENPGEVVRDGLRALQVESRKPKADQNGELIVALYDALPEAMKRVRPNQP